MTRTTRRRFPFPGPHPQPGLTHCHLSLHFYLILQEPYRDDMSLETKDDTAPQDISATGMASEVSQTGN